MVSADLITQLGKGTSPSILPDASGVNFSTSRLKPGQAFFALPGQTTHGIQYADQALKQGAAFIVSDKPHPQGVLVSDPVQTLLELGKWGRKHLRGPVIGVTGSAGKTSTKAMIAATLDIPSTTGNLNTPLALATTLVNTYVSGKPFFSTRAWH